MKILVVGNTNRGSSFSQGRHGSCREFGDENYWSNEIGNTLKRTSFRIGGAEYLLEDLLECRSMVVVDIYSLVIIE